MYSNKVSLTLIKSNYSYQEYFINVTIFRERVYGDPNPPPPEYSVTHVGTFPISDTIIDSNVSSVRSILRVLIHNYDVVLREALDIIIHNKYLYYNNVRHLVDKIDHDSVEYCGVEYAVNLD